MTSAVDRLHIEVETIAKSDSPIVTYSVISPEGRSHSATTWFAPSDELDILTFCAPTRRHSQFIEACEAAGELAIVSGGMHEDGQKKSQDVHGVTFEGTASRLKDPRDIEAALATFLVYGTFKESEIDKYLNHATSEVPAHGVYRLRPTLWTIMDGRLGPEDPERLVHLPWPQP